MIVLPVVNGVVQGVPPADAVPPAIQTATQCIYYQPGDTVPILPLVVDPNAAFRRAFAEEAQSAKEIEFAHFVARAGAPSYKASSVHIAAEKLGVMVDIEAAVDTLVRTSSDKSITRWWQQIDQISRGDAQWLEIEAAVDWKTTTAEDLFTLAAQIG
jgi:inactivated superfamily I helicase